MGSAEQVPALSAGLEPDTPGNKQVCLVETLAYGPADAKPGDRPRSIWLQGGFGWAGGYRDKPIAPLPPPGKSWGVTPGQSGGS